MTRLAADGGWWHPEPPRLKLVAKMIFHSRARGSRRDVALA
jgi:hypothetical protein